MLVEIVPQPDHLLALVSGTFDHARLPAALREIFAASSRHRLFKIIIDSRRLQGEVSLMARYDLGCIAAELQQEPVRLAVVASEHHVWPDRFGETVANNRGVRTKVTTDMAEALVWLQAENAGAPRS